jgi:chromosomal replication initiator protein
MWQAALGQLQMEMPRASYDTWVRDSEILTYEDGVFVIGVQNAFARDWLQDRLHSTVKRVLTGISGRSVEVRFVVWQDRAPEPEVDLPESAQALATSSPSGLRLNQRYTFESFVVGSGNRLACAAALAVSENPAEAYNPLFIYGGVGLGKTHLLHALGQGCERLDQNVLYVSAEDFTNDLVNAIRTHNTEAFRERYRMIDVLLIDDIQFIAGKESTQEEFFHTFNTLHGQDKQIVVSSDRPPKAMVTLEERLRSRFEWGLITDIQPPDYETRLAILRSKAERMGRELPAEVLELIARRIQSNIRELEGALTRVLAFADLSGTAITAEMAEIALVDFSFYSPRIGAEEIIEAVADHFALDQLRILGRERSREVALPRQIAMYLIREETGASLPQIGETLGGRDHTTVLYGFEKITEKLESDDILRKQVGAIRQELYRKSRIVD